MHMGGTFTLSDDAHAIEQVGLNYHKVYQAISAAGIQNLSFLQRTPINSSGVSTATIPVAELTTHPLFSSS